MNVYWKVTLDHQNVVFGHPLNRHTLNQSFWEKMKHCTDNAHPNPNDRGNSQREKDDRWLCVSSIDPSDIPYYLEAHL